MEGLGSGLLAGPGWPFWQWPMAASAANTGIGVFLQRPRRSPRRYSVRPLSIKDHTLLPFSAASSIPGLELSADAGLGGMAIFAILPLLTPGIKASPQ